MTQEQVFNGPAVVKLRRAGRAGFNGLKSYPRSVTTLGCQLSKTGFKTGLTKDEESYYEGVLDLKPGTLSRHSKWWGEVFNNDYPIRLDNNKTNELLTDNAMGQLKYKVLLEHSRIGKSEAEQYNPEVIFYIDDQEAKAKKELETFNFELEGMTLIIGMSPTEKRSALRLLNKRGVDEMSENILKQQLHLEMKRDPKAFFDTMTDKQLMAKAWIYELVEKGFLEKKGLYFIHNDETIANNIDECVQYFNNPRNASVTLTLKNLLDTRNGVNSTASKTATKGKPKE
jgi:hypothetical protein